MRYKLCEDCTMASVNDDFTGLSYYLEDEFIDDRIKEIKEGLKRLGTIYHSGKIIKFDIYPCDCCKSRLAGERHIFKTHDEM